ncbi:UNVERIFIED_ORG: rhamnulokinase [Kosakonia oryzae]|uniref:Rhamnulokinase n=1 Tax=Kosakonia radicincitans TaxID=283686 RepID=A0AAX2EZM5_9ENTR|nr:rhamnulokinase [Kosakonia radicincitans]MDP9569378.1 rhamnulokinase [Kosakonia oryzae]SFF41936.1 rhamnulokinase [Kosakonia radicincitans]SFR26913.1 rhamnulokinase [Kosakonia radicincitans]SFU18063.1 rhamnulokinase [Kosakonia radicincitans]SFY35077.1 rhamnulokinase [Kosakonia radicincitans]
MTFRHCVAVDLGASSGRVMLARYDSQQRILSLREIYRFSNCLQKVDGFDCWDIDSLESEIRRGLLKVCEEGIQPDSIGIDTWGVDYILINRDGQRVGLPIAYRDDRTDGVMQRAMQNPGKADIYRRSGIQFLPFNTLYQLRALTEQQPELIDQVAHALLIPDYFSYRLTGQLNWEYTNATTTQLVNINTDNWDDTLLAWAGVPASWFGTATHPGNVIGHWICPQGNAIPVVAVASHDTASAVIASPLADKDAAYLSSGTWSLMGFESKTPYTSDDALAANITNEGGAEGRYRVLKNIMGLWLLQRVLREQQISDLPALIAVTEQLAPCRFVINPNDDRFINPQNMSAELQAACREAGQPVPQNAAELARCIFDSLALLYADILAELAFLRGKPFSRLHIVGGGCQNQLLNQLCADACGLPVVAGPVEASTLGNIGIQLMTLDELSNVDDFRQVVASNHNLITFTPNPDHEIARYVARFQQKRQTKELCA